MALSLVYGLFAHEGIVVLRQRDDGTLLDRDSAWVGEWDAELDEWRSDGDEMRRARAGHVDDRGLPWPPADWHPSVALERLIGNVEVVPPTAMVGTGIDRLRISEWDEPGLLERAAGVGIDIKRDDDAVGTATARMFQPCSCLMAGVVGEIDLSREYNMFSSVTRVGRILPVGGRWALLVCPYYFDTLGDDIWIDAWTFWLEDPQAIHDTFSSDDFEVNAVEASPAEISAALRATGVSELTALAAQVDAITD